ncbi:MAG TPA: SBBP repeat-containing protein [Candidatus Nanopelagicaceae bacterium]|nr:SBBP repeat-containing protein [Candidatus Nanopelagicaceae bacterium]
MSFEPNLGQADRSVSFLAHGVGGTIFLTDQRLVLILPTLAPPMRQPAGTPRAGLPGLGLEHPRDPLVQRSTPITSTVVALRYLHANPHPHVVGLDKLPGVVNYFTGSNPARWHTNIPTYGRVEYQDLYPGIDLVVYGNQGHEEYDWVVAPGADPAAIQMGVEGTGGARLDANGRLVQHAGNLTIEQEQPLIYQTGGGRQKVVSGAWRLLGDRTASFSLGPYDHTQPLVIDPGLVYSTYLGGSGSDEARSIAVDGNGNAYVAGITMSTDFPLANALSSHFIPGWTNVDTFVCGLNAAGSALLFSTYITGSYNNNGPSLALDGSGNIYLAGNTDSTQFPTTPGAFQTQYPGGYMVPFVTKLNRAGNALLYGTYLGGAGNSGWGAGIAVDTAGNAYLTGYTDDPHFPTTPGSYQPTYIGNNAIGSDAFVTKLNASGSGLVYSTFLAGTSDQQATSIAIDSSGQAYIVGETSSTDYPTTAGAVQRQHLGGYYTGFVTQLNATGTGLVYSTYLGGSTGMDGGMKIVLDGADNAYVTGRADSRDFPITPGAWSASQAGGDGFAAKLSPTGSLLYSTYLAGAGWGWSLAVDPAGNAYITGNTGTNTMPTTSGAIQPTKSGDADAFLLELNPTGSALLYGTYLGGSGFDIGKDLALDGNGKVYIVGATASSNFPTIAAYQGSFGGNQDAFVAKLTLTNYGVLSVTAGATPSSFFPSGGQTTAITGTVIGPPSDPTFASTPLTVTTTIMSGTTTIHTLVPVSNKPHTLWTWDGKDDTGTIVPAGVYTATVTAVAGSGLSGTASVPITVLGDGPTTPPCEQGMAVGGPNGGTNPSPQDVVLGVNTQSGNYTTSGDDGAGIPAGANLGLEWTRYYHSESSCGSEPPLAYLPFGAGWTFTYDEQLVITGGSPGTPGSSVVHVLEDGQRVPYANPVFDELTQQYDYSGPVGSGDHLSYLPSLDLYQVTYCSHGCGAFFNDGGQLTAVGDPHDPTSTTPAVSLSYHGKGLTKVTLADGKTLTITSNATSGQISAMTDPQGNTWTYTYTGNQLTAVQEPDGTTWGYTYGSSGGATGKLISWTDPARKATTITYDDTSGRATSVTDPGFTTTFAYTGGPTGTSGTGPITATTITDPIGGVRLDYYDSHGRLRQTTDPSGVTAVQDVDAGYHPVGAVLAGSQGTLRTDSSYDANGDLLSSVDGLGNVSFNQYDVLGDLLTHTDQAGNVTTYQYDPAGDLLTSTDPLGRVTSAATYDANGNQLSLTDAAGHTSTFAYDGYGNQTSSTDPLGNTTSTSYDALGHPLVVTAADGGITRSAYDDQGRLVSQTDPLGRTTQYQYDALGRTVAVTDPEGGVTSSVYDANGNLAVTVDPLGNTTSYDYDALGRTIAVTDPLGNVTHSAYDGAGRLLSQADALGVVTLSNHYDDAGQLTERDDALGGKTTYAYDQGGRLLTETDPLGHATSYGYDALGRTIAVTDPAGGLTTSSYDANGRLTAGTDALGYLTSYGYDALGQTIAVTDPNGGVTRSAYDADGRLAVSTDPLGYQTRYGYDAMGRTVAVTDPTGGVTTSAYDLDGELLSGADPLGNTTSYGYDALGRTIAVTAPDGGVSRNTYDLGGRLVAGTDPLGATTRYGYDALGRTLAVTDALGNLTTSRYDADGRLMAGTDPLGNSTQYGYDALGRTIALTDALGGVTTSAYDLAGRLVTSTDPLGNQTIYGYDPAGRRTSTLDPTHQLWSSAYDAKGELIQTSDPLGDLTQYAYDPLGHTVIVTDALGHASRSAYDLDGRLLTSLDPLGNPTSYGYDALGRTIAVTDALGGVTTSSYDAAGRLLAGTDPLRLTTSYGYDALGRTIAVTDPTGAVTGSAYDLNGRLLTSTDPLGNQTSHGYDALGRTVAITDPLGGVTRSAYDPVGRLTTSTDLLGNQTHTAYDALGRTVAVTNALGQATTSAYDADGRLLTSTDALGHATSYGYDPLGRVLSSTDQLGNRTVNSYDAAGRLLATTDPLGQVTHYQYDALGRTVLVTDPTGRWTGTAYDPAGRVVSTNDGSNDLTTTQYDALGRAILVTDGAGRPTTSGYDAAGRLVSRADALGDTTRYGYDGASRQITVSDPLGRTTTYAYDPAGRLLSTRDPAGDTARYGYNALGRTVLATNPTGGVTTSAYNLGGELLSRTDPLGRTTRYGYDALGNTVLVTDGNGHVTTTNYDTQNRPLITTTTDGSEVSRHYDPAGRMTELDTLQSQVTWGYDAAGRTTDITETAGGLGGANMAPRLSMVTPRPGTAATVAGAPNSAVANLVAPTAPQTGLPTNAVADLVAPADRHVGAASGPLVYVPGMGWRAQGSRTRANPYGMLMAGAALGGAYDTGLVGNGAGATVGASAGWRTAGPGNATAGSRFARSTSSAGRTGSPYQSAGTTPGKPGPTLPAANRAHLGQAPQSGTSPTGTSTATPLPRASASPSPTSTALATATATPTQTATPSAPGIPDGPTVREIRAHLAHLPLRFEPNLGQAAPSVRYLVHGPDYTLLLTAQQAILSLDQATVTTRKAGGGIPSPTVVHLHLVGARQQPRLDGLDRLPGMSNILPDSNPRDWHTNSPAYAKVLYRNVYPGVDLTYQGEQGRLSYDFVLQPGADPQAIQLAVTGAGPLHLNEQGSLRVGSAQAALVLGRPVVYQQVAGRRLLVRARYRLQGGRLTFALGTYDRRLPLVIDPTIIYTASSGGQTAQAVTVDATGSAYVTGSRQLSSCVQNLIVGSGFPNPGAPPCSEIVVSKLNPAGTALVYTTTLGGGYSTKGLAIAVDSTGHAYVTGQAATNFPQVNPLPPPSGSPGPPRCLYSELKPLTYYACPHAVVAKLSADGSSLIYSTYLGGNQGASLGAPSTETGYGIAVDGNGDAYVTGSTASTNFPTAQPLQATYGGNGDAFLAKLSPAGNSLVYSTYLGGSGADSGRGITLNGNGDAYVTGSTSGNFPTANALQSNYGGGSTDAFVAEVNPSGSALVYSTYLGGSGSDSGAAIAVDVGGDAYVTGSTSGGFPLAQAEQATYGGGSTDAFVAEVNPTGSALTYSTYLGGNGSDSGAGITVDGSGDAYVTGSTTGGFPVVNAVQASYGGTGTNAFVSVIGVGGAVLGSSGYLGGSGPDQGLGIALDPSGNAYVEVSDTVYKLSLPPPPATPTSTATATVTATPTPSATPPPSVTMHLAYSYDAAGRRIGLTLPDGQTEAWGYDAAGRVSSLTQPGSGPTTYTLSHNGAGDLTTLLAPNGGQESWSYDSAGRITGTSWISNTTSLFTQTVTLDAAGQRLQSNDSWGTSSYGYDAAGRLTNASYPDGSSEADQYDAGGNRTIITSSSPLSGTSILTNTYDLADELTGSSGTQGNTTYRYDGNGQQLGSLGPTGALTNTYNDLGQLTQVQGPTTNVSYVYDGQGDRLRSYEQYGPTPVLINDAQDLTGGMSDLVSDGTADYTYLTPGSGQAPVSAYTQASTRSTYLATDVLGSVRLATDPTGALIGAGAYDAWGVYRPYTGPNGPTQLAGLQASSPFGYAGQYYDSEPGTYSMRARAYNPVQGRFLSQDPQSYDPQVPVTLNPYEYAGDMVTQTTDPSGRGWNLDQSMVDPQNTGNTDYTEESTIGGYAEGYLGVGSLQILTQAMVGAGSTTQTRFWVPISRPPCDAGSAPSYTANIVTLTGTSGALWDIEHVEAYVRNRAGIEQGIRNLARWSASGGYTWNRDPTCTGSCAHDTLHVPLGLGTDYPYVFGPLSAVVINVRKYGLSGYRLAHFTPFNNGNDELVTWQEEPGLLLFADEKVPPSFGCGHNLTGALLCGLNVLLLDNVRAYYGCANDDLSCRALALAGILSVVAPVVRGAAEGVAGAARAAGAAGDLAGDFARSEELAKELGLLDPETTTPAAREAEAASAETHLCTPCFPAGTLVATPKGKVAIEHLRVGDPVLAEDPKSGKVEPEPLTAVVLEPVQPLVAVDLSDGTTIRVTANHAFWVDGGPGLAKAGWLEAGQLKPGDRLRTATGAEVTVLRVRWNMGNALVYTLTVAVDHTFFVGTDGVLVHNAGPGPCPTWQAPRLTQGNDRMGLDHIVRRHFYGSGPANVGHFAQGVGARQLRDLISEAAASGSQWQLQGNSWVLDATFRNSNGTLRIIGTAANGAQSGILRVVATQAGEIVTAYPI